MPWPGRTPVEPGGAKLVPDGLAVVEQVMKRYQAVCRPGLPRFTGGAIGFIGYEFIHDIEPVIPRPPRDDLGTPVLYFLIADELLIFDRVAQTITILVNAVLDGAGSPEEAYEDAVGEIERLVSLLEQPSNHVPVDVPREVPQMPFVSNVPKEVFLRNVLRAKQYITAGDIIQVVGSQRFSTPVHAAPLDIYRAARSINPSPYMFLLELEGFSLVGASPGNPCALRGRAGGNPAHRRHAPARKNRGGRRRAGRRNCWPIPRNGPSTSCWWTWPATTWAASANSAAWRSRT